MGNKTKVSDFKTILKRLHFLSTVCFLLSFGYILVLELREVGVRWWVIFSLSGHSIVIGAILISLYLFAMFRGVSGNGESTEHPLTSSSYYILFYIISPFLGLIAGIIGMAGTEGAITEHLLGVSLCTLGTTFFVWIILDPLLGVLESLLPASRKHRALRLEIARIAKEQKEKEKQKLLENIFAMEQQNREKWQQELVGKAKHLTNILEKVEKGYDSETARKKIIQIGMETWQKGGLECMQQLYEMTAERCRNRGLSDAVATQLAAWWNGIGKWQAKYTGQKMVLC